MLQLSPEGTQITIRLPDDFHHHVRDGEATAAVLNHAVPRLGRCLIMPNLKPPVTNTDLALAYKERILRSLPTAATQTTTTFTPLMTLYLTDRTTPDEISKAHAAGIVGCKYYPAGATTNSEFGVTDIALCYPALRQMARHNMMLCIHSEVTSPAIDIFEREPAFLQDIMVPLIRDVPDLKITLEHISTQEAVDFVRAAPDRVKASITCHHLLYNRNHMLVGGIRPHLYCLPILKAEQHRQALVGAATSGSNKFFAGTDSAPHAQNNKEAACGCAGVFTAHAFVELYTEAFDQANALDKLEGFLSSFGADHYGIPRNTSTLTLQKKAWTVPTSYDFGSGQRLVPLRAGERVAWSIVSDAS